MISSKVFYRACFAALLDLLISASAMAGHYKLVKGSDLAVCEAYKQNLEPRDDSEPMACERHYDPAIRGFSSPRWQKLDLKKYFELYKKAFAYLWRDSLSAEDLRRAIDQLDERAKGTAPELFVARFDLLRDGKLINVLAVREIGCGPDRRTDMKINRLYFVNDALTRIDSPRQESWSGSYNNATIELYKGKPYVENYVPDDNWGHLFTGSGVLRVLGYETGAQIKKEFPDADVHGDGLRLMCEIQYKPLPNQKE